MGALTALAPGLLGLVLTENKTEGPSQRRKRGRSAAGSSTDLVTPHFEALPELVEFISNSLASSRPFLALVEREQLRECGYIGAS